MSTCFIPYNSYVYFRGDSEKFKRTLVPFRINCTGLYCIMQFMPALWSAGLHILDRQSFQHVRDSIDQALENCKHFRLFFKFNHFQVVFLYILKAFRESIYAYMSSTSQRLQTPIVILVSSAFHRNEHVFLQKYVLSYKFVPFWYVLCDVSENILCLFLFLE